MVQASAQTLSLTPAVQGLGATQGPGQRDHTALANAGTATPRQAKCFSAKAASMSLVLGLTLVLGLPLTLTLPAAPAWAQSSGDDDYRDATTRRNVESLDILRAAPGDTTEPPSFIQAEVVSRPASGNWFQKFVVNLHGALGLRSASQVAVRHGEAKTVKDSFGDLKDYQNIVVAASGWNGDRFFQYRLGLMFRNGTGAVQKNKAASYYWFTLASAQEFEAARRNRLSLLKGKKRLEDRVLNDVFVRFIEVYISGGSDAQFRLGQILESDFFDNPLHDQDTVVVNGEIYPRRRLIYAFASYLLADRNEHPLAERAIDRMRRKFAFTELDEHRAHDVANRWAHLVGTAEDPDNPFQLTPDRVSAALNRGNTFQERRADPMHRGDEALSWLRAAQAYQARGDVRQSKIAFETAINVAPRSRAALAAQEALQGLTTTCTASSKPNDLYRVREVNIAAQQRALKALGMYTGKVDNKPGRETRKGMRLFLASLNLPENDFLTESQTVELICRAAQLREDAPSQNMLGAMYAQGIGVEASDDLAHYWFGKAAQQDEPSAIYNMGMMYAELRVAPFINHPQSCDIARSYITEAAQANHPKAKRTLLSLNQRPACLRQSETRRNKTTSSSGSVPIDATRGSDLNKVRAIGKVPDIKGKHDGGA